MAFLVHGNHRTVAGMEANIFPIRQSEKPGEQPYVRPRKQDTWDPRSQRSRCQRMRHASIPGETQPGWGLSHPKIPSKARPCPRPGPAGAGGVGFPPCLQGRSPPPQEPENSGFSKRIFLTVIFLPELAKSDPGTRVLLPGLPRFMSTREETTPRRAHSEDSSIIKGQSYPCAHVATSPLSGGGGNPLCPDSSDPAPPAASSGRGALVSPQPPPLTWASQPGA